MYVLYVCCMEGLDVCVQFQPKLCAYVVSLHSCCAVYVCMQLSVVLVLVSGVANIIIVYSTL